MLELQKIDMMLLRSKHNDRKFLADARWIESSNKKQIIIFVHGFKGFKDWGHFNLIADHFARHGFVFIKLNFSHNGTSPEKPLDFVDLDAFGNNNFTIELDDLDILINHVHSNECEIPTSQMDPEKLFLIGHSRGGGICILKAHEDSRVKGLVTWAAVPDLENRWSKEQLEQWKNDGVLYILNSRTKQNMPLYYQLVEDYIQNSTRFSIPIAVKNMPVPMLSFHGDQDETVLLEEAKIIKQWNPNLDFRVVKGSNHTFGGEHPFNQTELPSHTVTVVSQSIDFLNSITDYQN